VQPSLVLASAINNQPALTHRIRELAILAVGATHRAAYVLYAHSRLAALVGLSDAQIASACQGVTPGELSEEEVAAYEFCVALAGEKGPLRAEVWQRAEEKVGKEVLAALVHVVGGYSYTCLLLNAGDVGVPEERGD
jgi:4-carboxymuconolactone decarboxylase